MKKARMNKFGYCLISQQVFEDSVQTIFKVCGKNAMGKDAKGKDAIGKNGRGKMADV